jgi:hypothetical protein
LRLDSAPLKRRLTTRQWIEVPPPRATPTIQSKSRFA